MEPLIHIKDLTIGYENKPVLSKVNLHVFDNDFIGIIGPNGGGKTTLLKAILGLIQPLEGKIWFRTDMYDIKKRIGYLPQMKSLDKRFPITVFDVVASGLMMKSSSFQRKTAKHVVNNLLEETGILDIRNKAIGQLSGGQMQRVFLCRAIISNPKILILDEPDTFVDNWFEGELYEKLRELNKEMAILLVSHDVGTVSAYVKTIACVNGQLHYHQSNQITQELLHDYNCPVQLISPGKVQQVVHKNSAV